MHYVYVLFIQLEQIILIIINYFKNILVIVFELY